MRRYYYLLMVPMLVFALAACGADPAVTPAAPAPTEAAMAEDGAMMEKPTEAAMAEDGAMMEKPTEAAMMEGHDDAMMEEPTTAAMSEDGAMAEGHSESMVELPSWQTLSLTDARTGQSFTLADFAGRTVYVEPMATWCSNCRQQLNNIVQAKPQIGEDVVFVALSVETNISNADLARYADQAGFDWTFAVATPEMLQELTATFGRSITNPPSTPHFIIQPDGTHSELITGITPADEIASLLQNKS